MATLDVTRSTKFVSIDTHPANNALVVTYEILAVLVDKASGRELAGRNKRHQLQVNISALDKLTPGDLKASKLVVNIQALSDEILNKCPLLRATNRNLLEDIQLHLLYLVGRRQSQLLQEQQQNGRPPSSVSGARLRSARLQLAGQRSAGSKRITSSASSTSSSSSTNCESEFADSVYSYLQTKHTLAGSATGEQSASQADLFLEELDERLNSALLQQSADPLLVAKQEAKLSELDVYLEGLYGDNSERLSSMAKIRELVREDANLEAISGNRLLVCAILRTLRDLNHNQAHFFLLSECIFYCLIRFTLAEEIFLKVFGLEPAVSGWSESDDLVKLLTSFMGELVSKSQADFKSIFETYHYINSLLVIMLNLLNIRPEPQSTLSLYKVEQKILLQQQQQQQDQPNRKRFLELLLQLFCLQAKCLSVKDIRLISKPEQVVSTLSRILVILKRLSVFKEFAIQLRNNQQLLTQFVDSLVSLIDTLQLTRPGSGGNNNASELISDKQTLNELYELEISTFEFVNNILYDLRIRAKLIARNLLKCVLRNLVIFFAKSNQNILSSYNRSLVLLAPFKCLYELSCDNLVKAELYKSRIVMKCLLEYLLSCSMDFNSKLELLSSSSPSPPPPDNVDIGEQIIPEAKQASHYIVCIWINLSARREAPIYGSDLELKDLVAEYLELLIAKGLNVFLKIHLSAPREHQLLMYLHLKLLRNLTQFLEFTSQTKSAPSGAWLLVVENFNILAGWLEQLEEASRLFVEPSRQMQNSSLATPMAVECLASLANLFCKTDKNWLASFSSQKLLSNLIERLFSRRLEEFESENDDLLLVSIVLLGTLARRLEICQPNKGSSIVQQTQTLTKAASFILSSRSNDEQMLANTLYTFLQLTNHAQFLKDTSGQVGSEHLDGLIERLTLLASHPSDKVSKLAVLLLNRLAQLEEQMSIEESAIKRKRFGVYNSKWLAAMRLSPDDTANYDEEQFVAKGNSPNEEDEEHQFYLDSEDCGKNETTSEREEGRARAGSNRTGPMGELDSIEEDDMLSEDDDEVEGSFTNEPDLNVIDSNSMIKHLTSRRHFRSSFEQAPK